jgi:hypothetical protein
VEPRKLSFRALDIEQIGHVYEGLLDHTAVRAEATILGLEGTKNKEPEVALEELERLHAKGEDDLLAFLQKETGRSLSALKKRIPTAAPHPLTPSPLGGEGEQDTGSAPLSCSGRGAGGEGPDLDPHDRNLFLIACNNDPDLFKRVLPWAELMRRDTFGQPIVIPAGSVFVTQGTDRRETGTHYTPKSLTEEIVKYTLEPLVYDGVAEGKPKEEWRLKSAAELLALKVCDMAMGSGAFLVQVCRYLSERLVEAWEREEESRRIAVPAVPAANQATVSPVSAGTGQRPVRPDSPKLRILPDGSLSTAEPGEAILPNDPDERLAVARRIVADRCLYGVDKNPMAVEMAKLSLWLITLQKNRPFTFLDHALRCGDSLLGVTSREQIEFLHLNPDKEAVQLRTVSEIWRPLLAQAIAKRKELESFTVNDIQDLARKEALQAEAEELTRNIKIAADYLIGEALAQAGKTGNLKVEDLSVLSGLVTDALEEPDERERENKLRQIREKAQRMLNAGKPEGQPAREPFHWALEFPEVFLEEDAPKGFSAIVGNPPFLHGSRVSSTFSREYLTFLLNSFSGTLGKADFCTYFMQKAFQAMTHFGYFGLVLTNSISEGQTMQAGTLQIVKKGGSFYRATKDIKWPGTASVYVHHLYTSKQATNIKPTIDGEPVLKIGPRLTEEKRISEPYELVANQERCFKGSELLGNFYLSDEEAAYLCSLGDEYSKIIRPFIGGRAYTSQIEREPDRRVLYLGDLDLEDAEATYPDAIKFLKNRFFSENSVKKDIPKRKKWWQFHRHRSTLYKQMKCLKRVLVRPNTSNMAWFEFGEVDWIYSNTLVIVLADDVANWAVLNSSIHEEFAVEYASRMKTDSRYNPSTCYAFFPFPDEAQKFKVKEQSSLYVKTRQQTLDDREVGLSELYSLFHDPTQTDPDIQTLRDLHIQMDTAVAAAYGWHDLTLNHDFHETKQGLRFTISEEARREVLDRLLELNHQCYAEEVAQGLHDKKKGKTKGKKKTTRKKQAPPTSKTATQGELF